MKNIIELLPNLSTRILTSATQWGTIPDFVKFDQPVTVKDIKTSHNGNIYVGKWWTINEEPGTGEP